MSFLRNWNILTLNLSRAKDIFCMILLVSPICACPVHKISLATAERCEWISGFRLWSHFLTLYFNILLISASLNKNKEGVGENNDVQPTILSNLTSALRTYVLHIDLHNIKMLSTMVIFHTFSCYYS